MIHTILNLANDELLETTLNEIKLANPSITFGERMYAPVMSVLDGKAYQGYSPDSVYTLMTYVPHIKQAEPVSMQATSMKIPFDSDFSEWKNFSHKYLHSYKIDIPHRKFLSECNVGDVINAYDNEFQVSPITVTEQMLKDHSYVVFTYGVSS